MCSRLPVVPPKREFDVYPRYPRSQLMKSLERNAVYERPALYPEGMALLTMQMQKVDYEGLITAVMLSRAMSREMSDELVDIIHALWLMHHIMSLGGCKFVGIYNDERVLLRLNIGQSTSGRAVFVDADGFRKSLVRLNTITKGDVVVFLIFLAFCLVLVSFPPPGPIKK